VDAVVELVWHGSITNDTFHALRAFTRSRAPRRRIKGRHVEVTAFRSRRLAPPSAEGRWVLVPTADVKGRTTSSGVQTSRPAETTKWAAAVTQQLLARHGVVTREAVAVRRRRAAGFGIVYPVLKGLGGRTGPHPARLFRRRARRNSVCAARRARFSAIAARRARRSRDRGAAGRHRSGEPLWRRVPEMAPRRSTQNSQSSQKNQGSAGSTDSAVDVVDAGRSPTRSVGATVILVNGALAAYLPRGDRQLLAFLPDAEPDRSRIGRAVARVLIDRARTGGESPRGMLIEEIDGAPPERHPMAPLLG